MATRAKVPYDSMAAAVMPPFRHKYPLAFEDAFTTEGTFEWYRENWTITGWISLVYVIVIFGIQRYMRDRPRYELRKLLVTWNILLAVFSGFAMVRLVPELFYVWYHLGWKGTFCNVAYFYEPPTFLWVWLFPISKVIELGDTLFIVLRKQPLIFLHWYHHITAMVYVWYGAAYPTAPARSLMVMNYTVHTLMYTYYALKAMRIHIPRWVSRVITTLQISQMVVALAVHLQAFYYIQTGEYCQQTTENVMVTLVNYSSYLVLFLNFFYWAYISPRPRRATSTTTSRSSSKAVNTYNIVNDKATTNGVHQVNGLTNKLKSQ